MDTAFSIIDILLRNQRITEVQARDIKDKAMASGVPVETILIDITGISIQELIEAKSALYNIPFIILSSQAIFPQATEYVSEVIARRYSVIPFAYNSKTNELSVACENPLDSQLIDFLSKKTGTIVLPYYAIPEEILSTIDTMYAQKIGDDVTAALKESSSMRKDIETKQTVIREAPIAQIVSSILESAVKTRSSDIHIEPGKTDTRIRYRIDGMLIEKLILPIRLHDAVVSRIKILSDLKIDEKRIPQDGRFTYFHEQSAIDLRISTLPTVHGEKVVMRLLRKTGGIPSIGELGLEGLALKNLEKNIIRPHGIILVTGPTGSGKTTSLYSVLSTINKPHINIVTLEDPVEYEIPGINQVQVNVQAGLTFANGLRAFLRQDPNIILVGEIRDSETTDLAIQAALTGHLVFSTLHTNNASGAIPRLLDLGAEPFLIASALNAIVGQRIVRKICPACKEKYTPDEPITHALKIVLKDLCPEGAIIELYRGNGTVNGEKCLECNGLGYYGRIAIFEVLPVSDIISKMVLTRSSGRDIERQGISEGMITMKQDGYLKALRGITTIEEVLRVAED